MWLVAIWFLWAMLSPYGPGWVAFLILILSPLWLVIYFFGSWIIDCLKEDRRRKRF